MQSGQGRVSKRASRGIALVAAASLAACSGGGGSDPAVTVSFSTVGGTVAEGAAPLAMFVVLHTSLAELSAPATVDVVDTTLGTATSASDYAAFAPVTVTFPIGSVDGDVQLVPFSPAADHLVEGANETVRFTLASATGAVATGSPFVATVTDGDFATIQFTTTSSAMPGESGAPHEIDVALDLPLGTTLGIAATARFADAGGGSASSGSDYAAVLQQTVSFPAGSPDGTTLSASVLVLDDDVIEADEVVRLALSTPGSGVALGSNTLHQMTIEDDDASGDAAIVVTQGATGTQNGLAYDALVDLGSQTVAAGANAGTLVRVTNAGGSPMELGTPQLSGSNPNDYDVVVDSAPLSAPPAPGEPGFELAPAALAPFAHVETASGPGVAFELDGALLAELATMPRATVHGFPIPGLGDVTLDLRRLALPIAANSILRVDGVDVPGGIAAAVGDLTAWSGTVLEMPGSRVFLAFSSESARGFVELPLEVDRFVHLYTERAPSATEPAACRVVRSPELAALGAGATPAICGGERFVPGAEPELELAAQSIAPPGAEALTAANCRVAIETDYQLFQRFGTTLGTTTYVTQLISAISDQYFTDLQTTMSIAYLGVHTTAADGWTSQDSGGTASNLLDEFRVAWNASGWPAQANLAHFISGANLGGGIAYVGVLCNTSFGYGVSGNVDGSITWGGWTGAPGAFTWDFVVVAHEIGHNFGSSHTHAYCPPLDLCYANCTSSTVCSQGTIMSYCHTCGGMDNIDLEFHPVCADIMRASVDASCIDAGVLTPGDHVQYRVRFAPLTATGTRTANLSFGHDAPNATQPFRIRLTGAAQ